jgi:peroxiredoxin
MASKKAKKEIRDWLIFATVLLVLYFTGLHTEVAAFAQRIVLATGVANPKVEKLQEKKVVAQYDFTLDGINGDNLNFDEQRGKVVFINFWATWCAPCIAEMPSIQSLYERFENDPDVVFVMISVDSKKAKAKKFIDKKEFTFPVYYPNASRIPNVYSSDVIPTTYVIDKEGYIVYKKNGMASYDSDKFIEFINNLTK